MLGSFLKIDYIVICFLKPVNSTCFFMGNDRLSGKPVGSQASRRVTQRLAWIQLVFISINAVPALKGLKRYFSFLLNYIFHISGVTGRKVWCSPWQKLHAVRETKLIQQMGKYW